MEASTSKPTRVVISQDLTAFLVEFSIALHKRAVYPAGHPSLAPAAARLIELGERLLADRPSLAFGVARHQLIIDGLATDPSQPVLRRLAETLHRHLLGAISILPGVESDELDGALDALAADVSPEHPALGAPTRQVPIWPHVRFHPLTLERLELIEDELSTAAAPDSTHARRSAQLWIGLANAAMAADSAAQSHNSALPDPAVVAKAIDEHAGTAAYDQVIVGYLLQISDELKSASGTDHGALRRRTARLIGALRPETLQRLVTMGGNLAQRRAFVRGATSGMAIDSVVKILKAAADASGQTICHGLIRMLSKLAAHAECGQEHVRPVADSELREQLDRLISGWELADPSPSAYARTLQHLATSTGGRDMGTGRPSDYGVDTMHIVRVCLEAGGSGPLVERAIDRAIEAGHLHALNVLLSCPPSASSDTADTLRTKLCGSRAMAILAAAEPLDVTTLDALLPSISLDGYEALLDALIASDNRTTRRKLLERLTPTHLDVAPLIVARLADERWYVQRNMLLLLERLGDVPPGFSVTPWTRHRDARVRQHGVALHLRLLPDERASTLRAALMDTDERIVRLGLLGCQRGCPGRLVPLVADVATNPRASEELRIHAVLALGQARDRHALATLLHLVPTTVLRRPKLTPTPIVLATLRALASVWCTHPEAAEILSTARRSSEPELRRAAEAVNP